MLAGVPAADRQAVMREHFVIERIDQGELLGERRRALARAGREITRHLSGKPRPALRGAADHDGVGAGSRQRAFGVVERTNVAIDDDRNRHRLLDGAHRRPVGAAVVELAARAAMHGDHVNAGGFARGARAPAH